MNKARIAVGLLVAVLAVPALAQTKANRMYKCVDEKGKVFYSDSPNTDCGKNTEMNRQGVIITKPEKAVVRAGPRDQHVVAASAERRDKALMATYTSEAEIDAARDRSLQMPSQALKASEARLDKANQDLLALKIQADTLASQQKTLPPDLLEDVQVKQKQVASLEAEVAKKKSDVDATRARYESDKVRYRELKGLTASARN